MPTIDVTETLPFISIWRDPGFGRKPGNEFFVDFAGGLTIWEDDGSPDRTGYFIPNKLFKRIVKLIADVHEVSGGSIKDWLGDA